MFEYSFCVAFHFDPLIVTMMLIGRVDLAGDLAAAAIGKLTQMIQYLQVDALLGRNALPIDFVFFEVEQSNQHFFHLLHHIHFHFQQFGLIVHLAVGVAFVFLSD